MNFFYDRCSCQKCKTEQWLKEGAAFCPYCGGRVIRDASGREKTRRVCRMVGSFLLATCLPIFIAAFVVDSAGLMLTSVVFAMAGAFCYANARIEEKRTFKKRRRRRA